jgi:hypothetical protein
MRRIADLQEALERACRAEAEARAVCRLVAGDIVVRPEAAQARLHLAALGATLRARLEMVAREVPDDAGSGPPGDRETGRRLDGRPGTLLEA